MTDPWDVPPLPDRGNEDADSIYMMVGKCLSQWEEVELELSRLYALYLGRGVSLSAMLEYGEPRIFDQRLQNLKRAAENFFTRSPNQAIEGEFDRLAERSRRFADRRNDIAHSIVRPLQWFRPRPPILDPLVGEPSEYALVPPYYTSRKFDPNNLPKYAYIAEMLTEFFLHFHELSAELASLHERVSRAAGS